MEKKEEKIEEMDVEKEEREELTDEKLVEECKKSQEGKEEYEKAAQLDVEDKGRKCTIKRRFKFKSKFPEQEFYYSVLLEMEDGTERWKSLNGWDKAAIATGTKEFQVGIEKYKGNLKLVLKPVKGSGRPKEAKGGDNPPPIPKSQNKGISVGQKAKEEKVEAFL